MGQSSRSFYVCLCWGFLSAAGALAAEPEGAPSHLSEAERLYIRETAVLPVGDLIVRAQRGEPAAQAELGARYGRGDGVPKDRDRALELLRTAAAKNDPDAEFYLGNVYASGAGVPKNIPEAVLWYQKAAAQKHPAAEHRLAQMIVEHQGGLSGDWNSVLPLIWDAADKGYSPAEFMLGFMYQYGDGVDQSAKAAAYWYRRTLSRQPYPGAETNLRNMIDYGDISWEPGDPGEPPDHVLDRKSSTSQKRQK
jgi:uncharacterized protein